MWVFMVFRALSLFILFTALYFCLLKADQFSMDTDQVVISEYQALIGVKVFLLQCI